MPIHTPPPRCPPPLSARHAAHRSRNAAAMRALPSGVRGPVLVPPCHCVRPAALSQSSSPDVFVDGVAPIL